MSQPFIGEVRIISFNFPPKGWAFCNGALLSINQNQAMFSILGTTFGGDGRTTFGLPDLRGRIPVHVSGSMPLGSAGGETAHTLTINEMASHVHVPQASKNPPNQGPATGNVWAALAASYAATPNNNTMSPQATSANGGSQPHDNMSPYLVLNFIIALQGIFPSRN